MKPTGQDYAALGAISIFWGSAFVAAKIGLQGYTPLELVNMRLVLAAIILSLFMWFSGERMPRDWSTWRILIIAGITGMAVPFGLITWGLTQIDSALSAIIIGAVPIMTLALSHWTFHDHKITQRQAVGMVIGFIGLFILLGGTKILEDSGSGLAKIATLLGAFGYAFSSVQLRKISTVSAIASTTGLNIVAAIVVLIPSLFLFPIWDIGFHPTSFGAIAFLALFSTAIGTLIMTRLIFRVGPPFMSFNNYMVPPVAIFWGAVLFDEKLNDQAFVALLLILSGIAIATYHRKSERIPPEEKDQGTPKIH